MKKILLLLLLPFLVSAQSYPEKPSNYVTDQADVLSGSEQNAINTKLREFEDSTSNQIFVFVTKSLEGRSMDELCQEIFHKWEIGSKGKNNGVLIAIFIEDHKFRIHTGYGLEGALPDVLTKRIQDEDMRPDFKSGNYYTGIDKGIDKLIYYSRHEYKAEEKEIGLVAWLIGYAFNALLLAVFIFQLLKSNPKKQRSSTAKNIWLIVGIVVALIPCIGAILLFIMTAIVGNFKTSGGTYSSGSSSSYDSSSSYSSSDSYDSGSSFDGGGGGDSGGGGSSSDW